MGTEHHPHSTTPSALNHETTDVNLTGITRLAIASLVLIWIILAFVWGFERLLARFLTDPARPPAMADWSPDKPRAPKGPVVIPDEPGLLRQLHAEEKKTLEKYAWIDKGQGIVQIPIDRALELVAKNPALIAPQGAPPPPTPAPAPAATPAPPAGK
jgi:hypothetical protein